MTDTKTDRYAKALEALHQDFATIPLPDGNFKTDNQKIVNVVIEYYEEIREALKAMSASQSAQPAGGVDIEGILREVSIDLSDFTGNLNSYLDPCKLPDELDQAMHEITTTLQYARNLLSAPSREGGAWRDIASAPRDGTKISLLYEGKEFTGNWYTHSAVIGWVADGIDCNEYEFNPTHWKPITKPSATPETAKDDVRIARSLLAGIKHQLDKMTPPEAIEDGQRYVSLTVRLNQLDEIFNRLFPGEG